MESDRLTRWRLILGKEAQEGLARMGGRSDLLAGDQVGMDDALGEIYSNEDGGAGGGGASSPRSAGLGGSSPRLAKWLGDIRNYFPQDVVTVIQRDAIERKGLKELLFEPETLAQITPDISMVATLMTLKDMVPDRAKDTAREIIRSVVEEIMRKMRGGIEQAVRGAIDRSRHSPVRALPNMDWKRTIQRNLKNYNKQAGTIIPDQFFFYSRQQRRREWNIIVCMDQSGSMAESVVYGSVMGAIFASIPALQTHMVVFDTEVVDLTAKLHDPVDLLFGVQLGGGTDINRAVTYCASLIQKPEKTLFILISDLYEGGNAKELVERMEEMTSAGVKGVCMLALSDKGTPSHDEAMAKRFANVGVPCFGCTPNLLPPLIEGAIRGQDLAKIVQGLGVRAYT